MDKNIQFRIPRRWLKAATVFFVAAAILAPVVVIAADKFIDVPASNTFHSDIAWLADNGVTQGCNPPANDRFCPSDNVTREQMAAFMKRLATGQAVDAGTLEGNSAGDLTSDVYSVYHDAAVQIPGTTSPKKVLELTGLPAGSYLIIGKTYLRKQGSGGQGVTCELVAGADFDRVLATVDGYNHLPATLTVLHTFAADNSSVQLNCEDFGADVTVNWTKITALSVDGLTNNPG
ncbi:hypothetical protein BMS3Bbin02_00883 [bacterium BMS3Bbin02]|nr:hypothetical protein BMS3Bbin02_00883 [bacterium BMS3Bbin02]